jgi:cephalosporin hydroxylase
VLRRVGPLLVFAVLITFIFFEGVYLGPYFVSSSEVVRRYHIAMYANPAMWNLRWVGIPTTQNPNDVWIIQEIISEIRPDFVVETGTAYGGSATIWAMVLRQVNPAGRVITIDIEDMKKDVHIPKSVMEMTDFVIGNSVDPAIVEVVREKTEGKKVVVVLDSDHHKAHVLKELRSYAEMVSVGSYVIVQDTDINGHPVFVANYPGEGPMEAVNEFLASNAPFQIDKTREKLLFTMHPNGYLKRIK